MTLQLYSIVCLDSSIHNENAQVQKKYKEVGRKLLDKGISGFEF